MATPPTWGEVGSPPACLSAHMLGKSPSMAAHQCGEPTLCPAYHSEQAHPPFLPIQVPGLAEIQEFRTASCIQGCILFYHAWVWCGCEAGQGVSVGVSPELQQRGGPRVAPTAQSWELLPHP